MRSVDDLTRDELIDLAKGFAVLAGAQTALTDDTSSLVSAADLEVDNWDTQCLVVGVQVEPDDDVPDRAYYAWMSLNELHAEQVRDLDELIELYPDRFTCLNPPKGTN